MVIFAMESQTNPKRQRKLSQLGEALEVEKLQKIAASGGSTYRGRGAFVRRGNTRGTIRGGKGRGGNRQLATKMSNQISKKDILSTDHEDEHDKQEEMTAIRLTQLTSHTTNTNQQTDNTMRNNNNNGNETNPSIVQASAAAGQNAVVASESQLEKLIQKVVVNTVPAVASALFMHLKGFGLHALSTEMSSVLKVCENFRVNFVFDVG